MPVVVQGYELLMGQGRETWTRASLTQTYGSLQSCQAFFAVLAVPQPSGFLVEQGRQGGLGKWLLPIVDYGGVKLCQH